MKFIILIFSIIGISFVGADVVGTSVGGVNLLPYLNHATEGFISLYNSIKSMANAMDKTSNCGSSGSSEPTLKVAAGNDNVANAFTALATALRNQTSGDGQLKLMNGDISEVVNQIENSAKALDSLSQDYNSVTESIDQTNTVSFDGVDKLISSLEHLASSSGEFNEAFTSTTGVSNLLLKSVSVQGASNFTNSVGEYSRTYLVELNSIKSLEERCGISTGLEAPITDLFSISNTVFQNLKVSTMN